MINDYEFGSLYHKIKGDDPRIKLGILRQLDSAYNSNYIGHDGLQKILTSNIIRDQSLEFRMIDVYEGFLESGLEIENIPITQQNINRYSENREKLLRNIGILIERIHPFFHLLNDLEVAKRLNNALDHYIFQYVQMENRISTPIKRESQHAAIKPILVQLEKARQTIQQRIEHLEETRYIP